MVDKDNTTAYTRIKKNGLGSNTGWPKLIKMGTWGKRLSDKNKKWHLRGTIPFPSLTITMIQILSIKFFSQCLNNK
jgi:hypothetical protein